MDEAVTDRAIAKLVRAKVANKDAVLSVAEGGALIELIAEVGFLNGKLNILRQWYNAVDDSDPKYLEDSDHILGKEITKRCLASSLPHHVEP